jgi:hypothetical protein
MLGDGGVTIGGWWCGEAAGGQRAVGGTGGVELWRPEEGRRRRPTASGQRLSHEEDEACEGTLGELVLYSSDPETTKIVTC